MQGVLAAVFSTMFGSKDPEQVNTMAKQAGEVSVLTGFEIRPKNHFHNSPLVMFPNKSYKLVILYINTNRQRAIPFYKNRFALLIPVHQHRR